MSWQTWSFKRKDELTQEVAWDMVLVHKTTVEGSGTQSLDSGERKLMRKCTFEIMFLDRTCIFVKVKCCAELFSHKQGLSSNQRRYILYSTTSIVIILCLLITSPYPWTLNVLERIIDTALWMERQWTLSWRKTFPSACSHSKTLLVRQRENDTGRFITALITFCFSSSF